MTTHSFPDNFLPPERLIRSIIYKILTGTGVYLYEEADDLYQEIILDLLQRKSQLEQSFRGLSKHSTYLYTVICRKCLELKKKRIRENKSKIDIEPTDYLQNRELSKNPAGVPLTEENQVIVKEYCKRLAYILDTYGTKKPKLVFSMKSVFRIVVRIEELNCSLSKNKEQEQQLISTWIEKINDLEEISTDQEVYVLLTLIYNLLENKHNTNDAIRKWLEDRLDQIIVLLNRPPARSEFNRETLQYLTENCHSMQFLS
jgi:RNA polymerase sigma factor (sigma-70 family)